MNRSLFLAATAAVATAPLAAGAADPVEVKVSFFPGASAWPMYAAIDNGFFDRAGLHVTLSPTPNSVDLFQKLDSGTYDIAHTSIDNPIAYDIGAGGVKLKNTDFVAFFGVDDGQLRLVAKPGMASIEALRGKSVAVDAPSTGYAFALREMLASGGLGPNDVKIVVAGGTNLRYAGLIKGDFDATLVTPPYDFQANEKGFVTLGDATKILGAYQGIAGVARRAWLAANRPTAIAYLRAYRAALDSVAKDRAAAIPLFIKHNPGLSEAAAGKTYDAAFARGAGFHRDAGIDMDGTAIVLQLRAKYAAPGAGSDSAAYVDTSILRAR